MERKQPASSQVHGGQRASLPTHTLHCVAPCCPTPCSLLGDSWTEWVPPAVYRGSAGAQLLLPTPHIEANKMGCRAGPRSCLCIGDSTHHLPIVTWRGGGEHRLKSGTCLLSRKNQACDTMMSQGLAELVPGIQLFRKRGLPPAQCGEHGLGGILLGKRRGFILCTPSLSCGDRLGSRDVYMSIGVWMIVVTLWGLDPSLTAKPPRK